MARAHIVVPFAVVTFVFLVIFQLVNQFDVSVWRNVFPKLGFGFDSGSSLCSTDQDGDEYMLGVGKADITGPIVEINLMGYADPNQLGTGLRQRLYSRAFIVGSKENNKNCFVYLILDTQSGDTAVRNGILDGLKSLGGEYAVYTKDNVAVTGTHSHSGPGAWLNYLLPQITSKGFNKQSYQAIVDGAIFSIVKAHESLAPGKLTFGSTEIKDANINRSLFAYLANPEDERKDYKYNVDKTMTLLKLKRSKDGKDIGILNWFPVHGTSMLGNNTLITGDNKGVAASLFEKYVQQERSDPKDPFVAGFSQSNVGDTSPNVLGAYCEEGESVGQECRLEDSTCDGRNEPCHGRGPFFGLSDGGTKSCYEIGKRQFAGAKNLFTSMQAHPSKDSTAISGSIGSFHTYRDFSDLIFTLPNGSAVSTCPAALGYSFAAGTTDGPGAFDFKQNNPGDPKANPLWAGVRNFLHKPSDEQKACHAPKPILLDVGETTSPYLWSPNIVDVQLLRVGQLIIIVSPGEATTMAGRRWKAAIAAAAKAATPSLAEPLVVLGGPANTYTHYIATEEEYAVQRYEGASTLYGPHTLAAHIHLTTSLLPHLFAQHPALPPGPSPPIHTNSSLSFITPVVRDSAGLLSSFGDLVIDVDPPSKRTYAAGATVAATFIGANPRNNLHLEGTYAAVVRVGDAAGGEELLRGRGPGAVVRTDADWDLVFSWRRTNSVLGTSEATIAWEVGAEAAPGLYRLRYQGDAKGLGGSVEAFDGWSGVFEVV